ncbi:hypothetical protein PoB_000001500 [Plakobranchus ocellatus]|uniref:Uncharacterized protein n=1 Tax=Plakobranchus ocellatus TaxID=259542 RepID=A0AAV3XS72_9GAST|nr:hypothetical protein PoB_000001500 [Plakobranchus ocellatus]
MHRIRKAKNSPRTLYNGPFVLSDQMPGRAVENSCFNDVSSSLAYSSPKTGNTSGYTSLEKGHAFSPYKPWGPSVPWTQPAAPSPVQLFLRHNSANTPRSDEGCRPVFNFSFLEDSPARTGSFTRQQNRLVPNNSPGIIHLKDRGKMKAFPSPALSPLSGIGWNILSKPCGCQNVQQFENFKHQKNIPAYLVRNSLPQQNVPITPGPSSRRPFQQHYPPGFPANPNSSSPADSLHNRHLFQQMFNLSQDQTLRPGTDYSSSPPQFQPLPGYSNPAYFPQTQSVAVQNTGKYKPNKLPHLQNIPNSYTPLNQYPSQNAKIRDQNLGKYTTTNQGCEYPHNFPLGVQTYSALQYFGIPPREVSQLHGNKHTHLSSEIPTRYKTSLSSLADSSFLHSLVSEHQKQLTSDSEDKSLQGQTDPQQCPNEAWSCAPSGQGRFHVDNQGRVLHGFTGEAPSSRQGKSYLAETHYLGKDEPRGRIQFLKVRSPFTGCSSKFPSNVQPLKEDADESSGRSNAKMVSTGVQAGSVLGRTRPPPRAHARTSSSNQLQETNGKATHNHRWQNVLSSEDHRPNHETRERPHVQDRSESSPDRPRQAFGGDYTHHSRSNRARQQVHYQDNALSNKSRLQADDIPRARNGQFWSGFDQVDEGQASFPLTNNMNSLPHATNNINESGRIRHNQQNFPSNNRKRRWNFYPFKDRKNHSVTGRAKDKRFIYDRRISSDCVQVSPRQTQILHKHESGQQGENGRLHYKHFDNPRTGRRDQTFSKWNSYRDKNHNRGGSGERNGRFERETNAEMFDSSEREQTRGRNDCSGNADLRHEYPPLQQPTVGPEGHSGEAPRLEILDGFMKRLRCFATRNNSIQTLHDCAASCGLRVKIDCVIDDLGEHSKQGRFAATLSINEIYIARRIGDSRRTTKQEVYNEAVSVLLRSHSAQDIVTSFEIDITTSGKEAVAAVANTACPSGQNSLSSDIRTQRQATCAGNLRRVETKGSGLIVGEKRHAKQEIDKATALHLNRLIHDLKSSKGSRVEEGKSKVSQIWIVDKHCVKNRLKLLAVYKGIHHQSENVTITCDLYLCERFLAQGSGNNRKLAQAQAYNRGCEVLRKMVSFQDILTLDRLDSSEFKQPELIDIVHKGYQVVEESNLCRLNRIKQPPVAQCNLEHLIILEHEDWSRDRRKHAHCILSQSATQCGCLLEWRSEPCARGFRCTMTLQAQQIASCVTRLRKDAVRMASIMALFAFYETQPVVQGFHMDYPANWTTRDQLKEVASTIVPAIESSSTESQNQQQKPREQEDEEKSQVEESIAAAIDFLVDGFSRRDTLEVIVCAPDWRTEEKRHLRGYAAGSGLRVVTENYREDQILVVSHKHSLYEIYEILKKQPTKAQGRYKILRDEEKPCYMDVAAEIAGDDSIIEQCFPPKYTTHKLGGDGPRSESNLGKRIQNEQEDIAEETSVPESLENGAKMQESSKGAHLSSKMISSVKGEAKNDGFIAKEEMAQEKEAATSGGDGAVGMSPQSTHNLISNIEDHHAAAEATNHLQCGADETSTHRDNSRLTSNDSDVFVSANNTLNNAITAADQRADDNLERLDTGSACDFLQEGAYPPVEFPRPRVTSTPSSHRADGSMTPSHFETARASKPTGANRFLAFPGKDMQNVDSVSAPGTSPPSPQSGYEGDGEQQSHLLSSSESLPALSTPSPSNPSSARLSDPSSSYATSPNKARHDKGCQCTASLDDCHESVVCPKQPERPPEDNRPQACQPHGSRRQNMERSIDVEACLGSPDQRAVCIITDQSSHCVRFSSEFATCNETEIG